jgi:hypothetical protein
VLLQRQLQAEVSGGVAIDTAVAAAFLAALEPTALAIGRFIDAYNDRCQPFMWTKDADELIAKIRPSKN